VKDAPFAAWAAALTPALARASARNDGGDAGDQPSHIEWRLEREPQGAAPLRATDPPAPAPLALTASPAPTSDTTEAASAAHAFALWRDRVWRFSSRLGVPDEALEDATQDVFAAVFRRWADFSGLSTRRTWVLGFVPKVASKYRRRNAQRRSWWGDERAAEERASGRVEHDPFEATARREARLVVMGFLDGLRDRDRQLFVLVDLEGESVVEAAAILELKTRHAYKCLERIRRDFEARMARHRAGDEWRLR
jgi:RNA polymerase sigma-70 factor, ECF subfamily